MTQAETTSSAPHRPAPNPRYMRDDVINTIDLLLGVETLTGCGDGYTESIRALTVTAVTRLEHLQAEIERMMK